MNIEFNLTGEERKKLVRAVSEIIGCPAEYQYMPTCSYTIGEHYTVTKDGMLIISDDVDEKKVRNQHEQSSFCRGTCIENYDDEFYAFVKCRSRRRWTMQPKRSIRNAFGN